MTHFIDHTLKKLAWLIQEGRYEPLETEVFEIKPVPSQGGEWRERHKTVNAFLNTRGGILLLGAKETGTGSDKKYVFTGWHEHAEPKLKELSGIFSDRQNQLFDAAEYLAKELRDFLSGKIALVFVSELPADRKFVFYEQRAYKRELTGDHLIPDKALEEQETYKKEAAHAVELQSLAGVGVQEIDLNKLNEYIYLLNQPTLIETIKPDVAAALPFLRRKKFVLAEEVTILGMLTCGQHPGDHLGFRCHVHGYVDVPQEIARDKQDYVDNILPLMESSLGYILRNIQVGVSAAGGGASAPQYPEEVLRETVNNALAHRDYSPRNDKQVIISIKPNQLISIRNPGTFPIHLLLEDAQGPWPVRRIIPEAKLRNPKLADVLRVFRKWEGRGIGMATLVNLALDNRMDLPSYLLHTQEVTLHLRPGQLVDDAMKRFLGSLDGYVTGKLGGSLLTESQQAVLAYLIKSAWLNEVAQYTILLTPDNNHFRELIGLENHGLIAKHPLSSMNYPVYVVDPVLVQRDYARHVSDYFGPMVESLPELSKQVLAVVYRYQHFSKPGVVTPKQASFDLWYGMGKGSEGIKEFEKFYRRVRGRFTDLAKMELIRKNGQKGFFLNPDWKASQLH